MRYVRLGSSGLKVSRIALGMMSYGSQAERRWHLREAQVALAWLLGKPAVTAPTLGATRPGHLDDAVAAVEVTLDADELARLEAPYRPHPVIGHH